MMPIDGLGCTRTHRLFLRRVCTYRTQTHTDTHYRPHGGLEIEGMNASVAGLADAAKNIFALVSKYILPRLCHHCVCFLHIDFRASGMHVWMKQQ